MVCTLIFSCTNTETNTDTTTTIAKDPLEENATTIVEDQPEETQQEEEPEVKVAEIPTPEKPISETKIAEVAKVNEVKKPTNPKRIYSSSIVAVGTIAINTVFMSEEEVALFNKENNEDNSNLAAREFELPSADDMAALRQIFDDLVDDVQGFASTEEDTTSETRVRTGAFDEVISITKSGEDVTDEVIFKDANSVNKKSLEYIRRPKPLVEYSGYKIELMTVFNQSLDLNDPLFKTFGGLMFKNNTLSSTTYYLGDFNDIKSLDDYLQKVVKTRFPKAKGVKFENGIEVKYK